jgi:hypothetical protein
MPAWKMSRKLMPMNVSPSTPGNQWIDGELVQPRRKNPIGNVMDPAHASKQKCSHGEGSIARAPIIIGGSRCSGSTVPYFSTSGTKRLFDCAARVSRDRFATTGNAHVGDIDHGGETRSDEYAEEGQRADQRVPTCA